MTVGHLCQVHHAQRIKIDTMIVCSTDEWCQWRHIWQRSTPPSLQCALLPLFQSTSPSSVPGIILSIVHAGLRNF